MKNLIKIAFALLLFPTVSMAQSDAEEIEMYQAAFGAEKKVIITEFVTVPEGDLFWTIYDEYEAERKELGKGRIDILKDYVDNYENMSDEKIDELVKEAMSLNASNQKLINKYYKKLKKVSGSKAAGQFYQLENYFMSGIRVMMMEAIPFLGELN